MFARDTAVQLTAGITYQSTDLISYSLGYKLLDTDLKRDRAELDDQVSGVILGVGFSF